MNHDSIIVTAAIIAGTISSVWFYFKGRNVELVLFAEKLNEIAKADEPLRRKYEAQSRELQDWREMFEAFVALPLPKEHRQRKLWPNTWHQDCAAVAQVLHYQDLEDTKAAKAAFGELAKLEKENLGPIDNPAPQNAVVTERHRINAERAALRITDDDNHWCGYAQTERVIAQLLANSEAAAVAEATTKFLAIAEEWDALKKQLDADVTEARAALARSEAECKQASKERDDATARLTDAKQAWLDSADPAKSPYIAFEDHQEQLTSVSAKLAEQTNLLEQCVLGAERVTAERDAANDALRSARKAAQARWGNQP